MSYQQPQNQTPPPATCTPQLLEDIAVAMSEVLVARNLTDEQITSLSKNYYSSLSRLPIDGATAEELLGSINAKIAINRALDITLLRTTSISLRK